MFWESIYNCFGSKDWSIIISYDLESSIILELQIRGTAVGSSNSNQRSY